MIAKLRKLGTLTKDGYADVSVHCKKGEFLGYSVYNQGYVGHVHSYLETYKELINDLDKRIEFMEKLQKGA
uniref:Uncharacterized protein n=1 Tax=viral metagenome TaxID=1070528 RepID=A0A6M3K9U7_9ZZZZ